MKAIRLAIEKAQLNSFRSVVSDLEAQDSNSNKFLFFSYLLTTRLLLALVMQVTERVCLL